MILEEKGLSWDGLDPFVILRSTLLETDFRFGQLGEKGIFAAMDSAGVLEHHVPGVDNIEAAVTNPPEVGRARLRGKWIRTLSGRNDGSQADWHGVWDNQRERWLDLADPFATKEIWQPRPGFMEDNPTPFEYSPVHLRELDRPRVRTMEERLAANLHRPEDAPAATER